MKHCDRIHSAIDLHNRKCFALVLIKVYQILVNIEIQSMYYILVHTTELERGQS